jgi:hypothetical protein
METGARTDFVHRDTEAGERKSDVTRESRNTWDERAGARGQQLVTARQSNTRIRRRQSTSEVANFAREHQDRRLKWMN